MYSVCRNISDTTFKYISAKIIPSSCKKYAFTGYQNCKRQNSTLLLSNLPDTKFNINTLFKHISYCHLSSKRHFSKKRGSKKREFEDDEESESDEEEYEAMVDENELGDSVITRHVPSLRVDNILKAGLGVTKKKIEQDFYAFKLRINGKPSTKKSEYVHVGDELDLIKGFSPDTNKYLTVDRVIVKGISKVSGTGNIPVKIEVLKGLTIENYEEPWSPSNVRQIET